ncbi:MAG TPA: hypothetical protein VLL82_16760 [Mycobacterium sp.]|nr:hypothetical protein [Mycobacterium sp.]
MALPPLPTVRLNPVALFPKKYFLENLAVRADESILITAVLQKELWWVPPLKRGAMVEPVLVHTFEHPATGIAEVGPDVFIISLTEAYTTYESHLVRIDFTGWTPGTPVSPEIIYTFDERVRGLNGSCLLGPNVLAIADCFAGLIWRVDLAEDTRSATARVWLSDDTMAFDPDSGVPPPPQPGINGLRYGAQTAYRWRPGMAAKSATSPATRSTKPSSGRPAPHGDAGQKTTAVSPTSRPTAAPPPPRRNRPAGRAAARPVGLPGVMNRRSEGLPTSRCRQTGRSDEQGGLR